MVANASAVPTDKGETVEQPIISGVAHDRSEAKVTVVGVPDKPGEAALIFEALADAEVNIDMIVQNVSAAATGAHRHLVHHAAHRHRSRGRRAASKVKDAIGFTELLVDDQIGKVSLIGAGMRTNAGISATFFRALSDAGVNVEMISTSEIRISVVTRADDLDAAVAAIHTAFGLDGAEGEAVVYGGTGR